MAQRRIEHEYRELARQPSCDWTSIQLVDDDFFHWEVNIVGPEGSPFANGLFTIDVRFHPDHPFRRPSIHIKTKIYHCNVGNGGGLDLQITASDSWSPRVFIIAVISEILDKLAQPDCENPLVPEIASLIKTRPEEYVQVAEDWTRKHAMISEEEALYLKQLRACIAKDLAAMIAGLVDMAPPVTNGEGPGGDQRSEGGEGPDRGSGQRGVDHVFCFLKRTLLHLACVAGFEEGALYLIELCGADTTLVDALGQTALHIAADKGLEAVTRALLRERATQGGEALERYLLTPMRTTRPDKEVPLVPLSIACQRSHVGTAIAIAEVTPVEHVDLERLTSSWGKAWGRYPRVVNGYIGAPTPEEGELWAHKTVSDKAMFLEEWERIGAVGFK